jgi:triosephosphate isomerase
MTPGIKPLVAGNWKMNGLKASLPELAAMGKGFGGSLQSRTDMLVCVPATLLFQAVQTAASSAIAIGAQDCHPETSGAHTGDISTAMIADCGASAVIVGHSERRTDHTESDETVCDKAKAAMTTGLQTIICIGETEGERKAGATLDILKRQMAGSIPDNWPDDFQGSEMIVAYEPVWAIGTGLTPTVADIEEAHAFMRKQLVSRFGDAGSKVRLLYGGSVKPSNAVELMGINNVDGALVGGASLKAADFLGIASAYINL